MKRRIAVVLLFILLCLSLCACAGKVPEGYDRDKLETLAAGVATNASGGQFGPIEDMTREDLKAVMSAAETEKALSPYFDALGPLKEISKYQFTSVKDETNGETYAVCVVTAVYENGRGVFTLSFNTGYELVGLYFNTDVAA